MLLKVSRGHDRAEFSDSFASWWLLTAHLMQMSSLINEPLTEGSGLSLVARVGPRGGGVR